jgi:hypothetical protein
MAMVASKTDEDVVAAMERAIVCVKAWIYVLEAKRAGGMPSAKAVQDAAEASKALAIATRLAGAADPGGPRFRAREDAAEEFQKAFMTNEADAERGDRAASGRIEKALAEVQDSAIEWIGV